MRCKIDVTPEMQNAGGIAANEVCLRLFLAKWNSSDAEQIACAAYRAMRAAAPVPLVSEAEDRVVALEAERDGWRKECYDHRPARTDLLVEVASLRAQLAAKDARIAELDSMLAQRPAPVPDTPKPAPNFTRDFSGDRRRMGP